MAGVGGGVMYNTLENAVFPLPVEAPDEPWYPAALTPTWRLCSALINKYHQTQKKDHAETAKLI